MERVKELVTKPDSNCTHVWVIKPPNGPTSLGSCRKCFGLRKFPNAIEPQPNNLGKYRKKKVMHMLEVMSLDSREQNWQDLNRESRLTGQKV